MQRAAIPACNNCTFSNVLENIHEAKVLQPMTAFGGIMYVVLVLPLEQGAHAQSFSKPSFSFTATCYQ